VRFYFENISRKSAVRNCCCHSPLDGHGGLDNDRYRETNNKEIRDDISCPHGEELRCTLPAF